MSSKIEIINMALGLIAVDAISDMDEDVNHAKKAKLYYASARDSLLRSFPWRFALKQWSAASVADADPFGSYPFAFKKPADCLRYLRPVDNRHVRGEVAGEYIYATRDPFEFVGIKRVTAEGAFDPMFVEALSMKLAAKLAVVLRNDKTLKRQIEDDLRAFTKESETKSAMEGPREEWQFESSWLNARLT